MPGRNVGAVNSFGVRLLPDSLRRVLFGAGERAPPDEKVLARCREGLRRFGLVPDMDSPPTVKRHPALPPLYGNVETHFHRIAQEQIDPYLGLLEPLLFSEAPPIRPGSWVKREGWTRYGGDGSATPVAFPSEPCLVFDVEVCVTDGPHPTLAVALTEEAWYGWCSPHLLNLTKPEVLTRDDLIPLGSSEGERRLVIGHNVSYDRARCSDEYRLGRTGTRYLDTMSLHVASSGMTSGQRMMKQKKAAPAVAPADDLDPEAGGEEAQPKWFGVTSLNNLRDVFQLYCPSHQPMDKKRRDVFVSGSLEEISGDFQNLMRYCADDVLATWSLVREVFPLFRERCPHPATLAGMLEMGTCLLPVSRGRWERYVRQADSLCAEAEEDVERVLGGLAKEACQLRSGEAYRDDLWMWDQDWTTRRLRMKKKPARQPRVRAVAAGPGDLRAKFYDLLATSQLLYKKQPSYPGYPRWFQDLAEKPADGVRRAEVAGLTPSKKIAPKLLRLRWMGYPLHRHATEKWGYLVPQSGGGDADPWAEGDSEPLFPVHAMEEAADEASEDGQRTGEKEAEEEDWMEMLPKEPKDFPKKGKGRKRKDPPASPAAAATVEIQPNCLFHRLPHKDGKDNRVGNPLAKDFVDKVREGVLTTQSGQLADRVLRAGKTTSYWRSNQDRIKSQVMVPADDDGEAGTTCVILPQLVPAGTLTRRAVERTWLTASNAKPDRIGSELKALVTAPPGRHLVGADVDSQELWIAAVLGDSHLAGEHGCSPLGWMTLQGNKAEGTDMHSMTAKTVGVSRDNAKVINYGRIYGAGVTFAKQLLQRFNPSLDDAEARKLAVNMYEQTKGERAFVFNSLGGFCFAGFLSGRGDPSADPARYVGWVASKADMAKAVKFHRKLTSLFAKGAKKGTWVLRPEAADVALQLGLEAREGVAVGEAEVFRVLAQVGGARAEPGRLWSDEAKSLSSRSLWRGGSESHSFNRLEEVALDWRARTPVLGCRISRALDSRVVGSDYLPSRINWVVQSSAVDYLHLLLAAMRWLCDREGVEARFAISIHDEVRYLVPSRDRYRAALCLQLANLLTRSMFCSRLGMSNLPESVAYFSGVDVDRVMRKDPSDECATPSNPQGLRLGCGVEKGECLSIDDLMALLENEVEGQSEGAVSVLESNQT